MKNLSKLIIFLFFLISLITTYYILGVPRLLADEDAVPEPMVPCTDKENIGWRNPEWSSQRPYQASPCGDSPKAYFCSNDYIIEEKVSTDWTSQCDAQELICPYNGPVIKKDYQIYLSDIDFPILGNTEQTANSENPDEEFDDAQKMNEYLAWYLSGTNQKAERGNDTIDETVNFAGPVKKLLPSVIQEFQRFVVLHDAGVSSEYTDTEEMEGSPRDIDPNKEGVQVDETHNHNQIVVCTTKNVRFFGFNINNPWVGEEIPTPCYSGGGKKANNTSYRMLQWWEGKRVGLIESMRVIERWDGSARWGSTIPPFPWQFTENIHYQKAYREWRGHECLIILRKLVCADLKIPGVAELHTNKWADFYQYIPLGTPVDKNSAHVVTGVNIEGLGGTKAERPEQAPGISASGTYFIEQNPILYYPHTQATYDITKLLNKTQNPFPQEENGAQGNSSTLDTTKDFEVNKCKIVDVRSNPGDSLTFSNSGIEEKQKVLVRDIQIKVTQVGCINKKEINYYLDNCPNPLDPKCGRTPSCDGIVQVVLPTTPKIPYAEQIWKETTVGNSAFRRIFPKIEEGAPVSCISDIPGVSDVSYEPSSGTNLVAVNTPDGKKGPGEAQLFFPHLGTIYEYFLNGIQTALRPKGYGEPIVSGELCKIDNTKSCEQVAEEYGIPSCQLEGIMALETGRGTNMGSESCLGKFNCCSAGVCGPAQIKCGDVEAVSGGENINVCDPCGASELLARLMKMKLCQADGKCNSYNWKDMERVAMPYEVEDGDYTAACYFYGLQNGCFPTACTQYRWGAGKSYDDAVRSMCETGNPFIGTVDQSFCAECAEEDPRLQCAI